MAARGTRRWRHHATAAIIPPPHLAAEDYGVTSSNQGPIAVDAGSLESVTGGADVNGTAGSDRIETGDGSDKVFAGSGNDIVLTNGGNDEVHAGDGDDIVITGSGDDQTFGGNGNDTISSEAGNDEMHGEAGNDHMVGGVGTDKAFGGEGNDSYFWRPGDGNDEFHGGSGHDTLQLGGVNSAQLQQALQLYSGGLQMLENSLGQIVFVDGAGQPTTFSGQITIGNEVIKFFEIERIQL